ncbi:MAG TPA: DUF1549 domain-containing protein, partial [Fimbriimonas sp.]|nr:DUF1549 domain-containing protein [Fimbriimonas sp.]
MSRITSLMTAVFAAAPFAILAIQQQKPLPPLQAKTATDVRTIFKAHCATCHSGSSPAAGLNLTTPEGIQKGGVSGKIFDLANPAKSLIVMRLHGEGGKPRMPLGMTSLTEDQVKKVAEWISQGAHTDVPDKPHWAYVKPVRPALPKTKDTKWARNPIDAFVLARLEHEGLRPSAEASKEVLARRVYLDAIGIPPTVEEVDAFLADKRPDAYERL